jgi:CheY-like chemotaxis protein/HPt (histidine-containing phosphotransfer) domain-containing protein
MNLEILWDAADGDAAFARELADLYLANTAGQLALLRTALAQGSASAIESIAHHCKGSSHTCGATTLASLFNELVRLGHDQRLAEAQQVVAEVEREFVRVRAALRTLPPSTTLRGTIDRKRILIVDDDPLITRIYEAHFRADGFEVRIAGSGNEGLDAVRTFLPDAVLLDLGLPDLNGVEWLKEIRKDARFWALPVLVLTAGAVDSQVWAASLLDVAFVFKEGAVPANVVKAIKAALATRRGTQLDAIGRKPPAQTLRSRP